MKIVSYEILDRTDDQFRKYINDYIFFRETDQEFINEFGSETLKYLDNENLDPEYIVTVETYFNDWYDMMCPDKSVNQSYIDVFKVLYGSDIEGLISLLRLKVSGWKYENILIVIVHTQY